MDACHKCFAIDATSAAAGAAPAAAAIVPLSKP